MKKKFLGFILTAAMITSTASMTLPATVYAADDTSIGAEILDTENTSNEDSETTNSNNDSETTDSPEEGNEAFADIIDGIYTDEEGTSYHIIDGQKAITTGVYKIEDSWYNLVDGIVTPDTVAKNEYGWWYINDQGTVDFTYNGFAENEYGCWVIENGKVNFSLTSVVKGTIDDITAWWYVKGGKVEYTDTIAKNEYGWWVIEQGMVDFDYIGLAKRTDNNTWWYAENGKVNFTHSGLAANEYGNWYVNKGQVTFTDNTVVKGVIEDQEAWWHVVNSKVTKDTTLAKNEYGWWYIDDGKVDFSYTGVAKRVDNGTWWRIENGKVNFAFTGIASNSNGSWYLEKGKVDFTYSGTIIQDDSFYDVMNGKATKLSGPKYVWPLPGYTRISSPFGQRICPFHGPEFHNAIDIPAPSGTPIRAMADGTVIQAAYSSTFGNYVTLQHADGSTTQYNHCSRLGVKVGQTVKQNQTIAYVGTTGSSTGNHLDLRLKINGSYVNPSLYTIAY